MKILDARIPVFITTGMQVFGLALPEAPTLDMDSTVGEAMKAWLQILFQRRPHLVSKGRDGHSSGSTFRCLGQEASSWDLV